MRGLVLGLLLALPAGRAAAQAPEPADLFARLDQDGNGYLSESELRSDLAARNSWSAVDRDKDGRVRRDEFTSLNYAEMPRSYSARQLVGAPVRDPDGVQVGSVRDLVVDARGRVRALALDDDRRVAWHDVQVAPGGREVTLPYDSASGGATRAQQVSPGPERRASTLLQGAARVRPGLRIARVDDLLILPSGEVRVLLPDNGPHGRPRRLVYPWPRVEFVPGRGIPALPGAYP